jgi:hypothetical protein
MKVCDTLKQLMLPVKTSLGKAAEKTSATVKKASEIASKILKVLFTPVTYLFDRAKSFYDKMRNQSAPADARAPAPAAVESDNSEDDEGPAAFLYPALEQQAYENLKASILGTDETLSARLARETIERERARQHSIHFGPVAPPSLLRHAPSDTQNSEAAAAVKIQALGRGYVARKLQKAEKVKSDTQNSEAAAAVKIQALRRGYVARKLQKAEKVKAEIYQVATELLDRIVSQATTQYVGRKIAHRVPAQARPKGGIVKPFVGLAEDFPALSDVRQNKSAERRGSPKL